MDLGLTLLAGYWIFRGLDAVLKSHASQAPQNPIPTPSAAEILFKVQRPVIPTIGGRQLREPTGTRYTDAKSLFGGEYVSFTRLDTFAKCKHKFKLTYLEGFRQEDRDQSRQAASGHSFHTVCEELFTKYRGKSIGKAMEDEAVRREPRIRQVLKVAPEDAQILAAELELRFRARDREFLGYVDLAVELPDTTVGLIDFKTGYSNQRYPPDPIQLDIYSIPELLLRPQRSVRLAFVLVDADRCQTWTNGPDNRDEVIRTVRERIVEAERESLFPPQPSGLCNYCHVRDLCEAGGGESVFKQFANRQ